MTVRILVTGAAGFVGHHTVAYLLEKTDWEILALDGLTYAGDAGRLTELPCFDPKRVTLLWHDLRSPFGERLKRRIGEVRYVLNIASESHVDRSIEEPAPFVLNNVALVLNVLDWVRTAGVEKVLKISTDEVYGPAPLGTESHEWDNHQPSNPYAASKAAQEDIAFAYWRTYGVPVVITNTMNNFGERQAAEKFLPVIVKGVLGGAPIPVFAREREDGSGWESGSRTWLHARNHADALLWLLKNAEPNRYPEATKPSRYHIGGEHEVLNSDLALLVGEILGQPAKINFVNFHAARPGHDLRYALNSDLIRREGWQQPADFEESLSSTMLWMVDHPEWLL